MRKRRAEMHPALAAALRLATDNATLRADQDPTGPLPKLTPKARQALEIVRANPGITAGRFAELMWKDSLAHRKVYNVGQHGAASGVVIKQTAGAFLSRLHKQGLVLYIGRAARLTRTGLAALEAGHE